MYFPVGWPKKLRIPEVVDNNIIQVVCNRDKILFVVLTDDTISVWFTKVELSKIDYIVKLAHHKAYLLFFSLVS